jgi:integrase
LIGSLSALAQLDRQGARGVAESAGVAAPAGRRREAAMVLPTTEQVAVLLAAVDPRFRAFVALAAFAGLRLGEAAGAQVGDVDFLRRRLTVARQVKRAPSGHVDVRPPTYHSERVVFLADEPVALLAEHVRVTDPATTQHAGSSR